MVGVFRSLSLTSIINIRLKLLLLNPIQRGRGRAVMIAHIRLLLLLPFSLRVAAATCFYPNGDSDSDHLPCGTSSVCCAEGFQCLNNGLCADPRYDNFQRVLRGGCTDKSWGTGCPSVCKDSWPDRDEVVHYCGNGKFCCDGQDCCGEQKGILDLGEPSVVATAGEQVEVVTSASAGKGNTEQATSAPAPASAPEQIQASSAKQGVQASIPTPASSNEVQSESATPAPIPSSQSLSASESIITASSNARPASIVTVINDHTLTLPAAPSPTLHTDAIYKGHNNTVAMGVGIGIGVAVLLIALVFGSWCFIRRRRKGVKPQGVTSRSIESNPFERSEYVVEMMGDMPKAAELRADVEPKEMDGRAHGNNDERMGKERELKTWPL